MILCVLYLGPSWHSGTIDCKRDDCWFDFSRVHELILFTFSGSGTKYGVELHKSTCNV